MALTSAIALLVAGAFLLTRPNAQQSTADKIGDTPAVNQAESLLDPPGLDCDEVTGVAYSIVAPPPGSKVKIGAADAFDAVEIVARRRIDGFPDPAFTMREGRLATDEDGRPSLSLKRVVMSNDSRDVAIFKVERVGSRWVVTGFDACRETLKPR